MGEKKELEGMAAIVTGSTGNIGKNIAIALAKAGAGVVINGRTSGNVALQVVNEIEAFGGKAIICLADVTKEEQVENLIDAAIKKSDLGLNPQIDGQLIRLPVPELNEERRTELKKLIKSIGEKCKVSIRNVRREANEDLKKLLKLKEIGEDEEKIFEKKVQTITDDHIKSVDDKVSFKEKEIMTI